MRGRVGVFDSGIGGLSVWAEIRRQLPECPLVYFADQANFPYGVRSTDELRALSVSIVNFLLSHKVDVITIACNSASAAALKFLRDRYPKVLFVGMEPAIKPAALISRSGVVAVLATAVTLEGELIEKVMDRYSNGVKVIRQPCQGLVECVENGLLEDDKTKTLLKDAIDPCLAQGVDTIVLGCTHYSFVSPLISKIYPNLQVVDPAPAVARRVVSLVKGVFCNEDPPPNLNLDAGEFPSCFSSGILFTSGDVSNFRCKFNYIFREYSSYSFDFIKAEL